MDEITDTDGKVWVYRGLQAGSAPVSGKVTEGVQDVVYEYVAKAGGQVLAHYVDEQGHSLVPDETVAPRGTQVGTPYTAVKQAELTANGLVYVLTVVPDNESGQVTVGDTDVTYVYAPKDTPDEPEVPDTPSQPGEPEVPDIPNQPGEPEVPDNPNQPEEPEVPDTPDEPITPSKNRSKTFRTITGVNGRFDSMSQNIGRTVSSMEVVQELPRTGEEQNPWLILLGVTNLWLLVDLKRRQRKN